MPVLQPLIGMDKIEIVDRAHEIGTFETSILPYEDCCTEMCIRGRAMVGAILFGAVLVFQLVTLPTEINASRRAMKTLESMYLLEGDELTGARKTLTAAAMTYVAAVASTALQFLRLVLLANRRRD